MGKSTKRGNHPGVVGGIMTSFSICLVILSTRSLCKRGEGCHEPEEFNTDRYGPDHLVHLVWGPIPMKQDRSPTSRYGL